MLIASVALGLQGSRFYGLVMSVFWPLQMVDGSSRPTRGRFTMPRLGGLMAGTDLEDGGRPAIREHPPGADIVDPSDDLPLFVQEDDVNRKVHAERVDAAASRDQQTPPGSLAWQQRQAEQSCAEALRDGDHELDSENLDRRESPQPRCELNSIHRTVNPADPSGAPYPSSIPRGFLLWRFGCKPAFTETSSEVTSAARS